MPQKVLLIHGFEGRSSGNWLPWLANELTSRGIDVRNETLPNPDHPNKAACLDFLIKLTQDFGKEDSIIGHSLGALFALELSKIKPLRQVILVAPALLPINVEDMQKRWPTSDVPALAKVIGQGIAPEPCLAKEKNSSFPPMTPTFPQTCKIFLTNPGK